jgi:DNA-binding CsgD family transcriptional regulator
MTDLNLTKLELAVLMPFCKGTTLKHIVSDLLYLSQEEGGSVSKATVIGIIAKHQPKSSASQPYQVWRMILAHHFVTTYGSVVYSANEIADARQRIAMLTEKCLTILSLSAIGMTHEQISLRAGCSQRTIVDTLTRAKRKLRATSNQHARWMLLVSQLPLREPEAESGVTEVIGNSQ